MPAHAPEAHRTQHIGWLRAAVLGANDTERRALLDALDDEYKSWTTCDRVIQDFGEVRPFINIRDAEVRQA